MEKMHLDTQGLVINGRDIRVISVGAIVAHHSEVVVFRVGFLCISLISITYNQVGSFMPHFTLPIQASLVPVIIPARLVVSHQQVLF